MCSFSTCGNSGDRGSGSIHRTQEAANNDVQAVLCTVVDVFTEFHICVMASTPVLANAEVQANVHVEAGTRANAAPKEKEHMLFEKFSCRLLR